MIFCLLLPAALWIPRRWSALPLLLATLLKLYPVFAITGAFIKQPFILFTASLAGAVAIFAYLRDQLVNIRSATPTSCFLAYGVPSITDCFIRRGLPLWELWFLFAAVGFATLTLAHYFNELHALRQKHDRAFDLMLIGAPIYVGTFMLSSNFDYRLIFLILCIPFLQTQPFPFARVVIVVILLAMNETLVVYWFHLPGRIVIEFAKTAIFAIFSAYLLALAWSVRAWLAVRYQRGHSSP